MSVTPETDRSRDERCRTIEPNHPHPHDAPLGIVAALCRMALLRTRSTSVNGAYIQRPAAFWPTGDQLEQS